jgi:O-antigen/teichoic acid export membrane protein
MGVWSLVFGRLAAAVISAVLTLRKVPAKLKPYMGKKEFKDLAGFGTGVSISQILQYLGGNVDYLVIGKFLNPLMLGLYTRAFNLMTESVNKITGGIYDVLFPAYSAVQNDVVKLRRSYFRTIRTISFFLFPLLASMIVSAEYIIKGLFGAKWHGAITSFQILALAGILRATTIYAGAIAYATGRVYTEVKQQLVYFLILGGCALFTVRYGIEGVAWAVVAAFVWKFIAQNWLALKIIESNWKEFFKVMVPGLSNMFLMVLNNLILIALLEKFFSAIPYEIKLFITIAVNIFVFICIIFFVPFSLKGDTFEWVAEKYKKFIPAFFIKFYFSFNPQKQLLK